MRPERPDIAAPPFRPGTRWLGDEPLPLERLLARGPVLVHFLDFAQLNSVRALPYLVAWEERYRDAGLAVVGVHSARWPLTADPPAAGAALARRGVRHPVAADLDYAIWHDYGCEGWPSLFLWGRGGALRWFHFGEGAYRDTELAIQEELRPAADSLPPPLAPLRPTDAPDATVIAPTPELLPGGSLRDPWEPGEDEPRVSLEYEGAGAFASADGEGELAVVLDGDARTATAIAGPGLYELARHHHDHHERHALRIEAAAGVRVWSISFAPGVPPPDRARRL
jgi:hypothetical protein